MVFSFRRKRYGVSALITVAKLQSKEKVTFHEYFIKYHFFDMQQSLSGLSKMLSRIGIDELTDEKAATLSARCASRSGICHTAF